MTFQPAANQEMVIDGVPYCVAEHPAAPGLPYGQEGRQAVVYQLVAGEERRALKVFKPRFRVPALVGLAQRLAPFAALPGLQVCRRTVFTPQRHAALLRQYPDLTYAVLMPWIAGPTWTEVLLEERALAPEESLALARSLAEVLAGMEQSGLAHCDLSGPNLLLPSLDHAALRPPQSAIELVDVEQFYGSGLDRPAALPGGSPGYAHQTAPRGLWEPDADRFAGAVLLAEMLGWCDARLRAATWGDSYFDPAEMQRDSNRYRILTAVLHNRWGPDVAQLLAHAWGSETLADCPTFGDWLVALPEQVPTAASADLPQIDVPLPSPAPAPHSGSAGPTSEVPPVGEPHLADDSVLAPLFDAGLAAYRRGDWAQTRELLAEVVRQQPGYRRDGQRAVALLAEAERRAEAPARPGRNWRWFALPIAVLFGFLALWAIATSQAERSAQPSSQATAVARVTELAATQEAEATTQTQQTDTALGVRTTNTAVAVAAAATAQTQLDDTSTTIAEGSATAFVAIAGTAETLAAATATAQAQITAVAEAMATNTAQAIMTAQVAGVVTAAAQVSATAQAAGLATAAAQASATAVAQAHPSAGSTFANPAFRRLWERTDALVAQGKVARTWFWGPAPGQAVQEQYNDAPGGTRLVQYFDKTRMEINNPNGDPNSPYFVTNGLLTIELISGLMHVGDTAYETRAPSCSNVFGDPDDNNAPTYAAFQGVSNTYHGDHFAPDLQGEKITATIDRDGNAGEDPSKSAVSGVQYAHYEADARHNIPQPFWNFLNSYGVVYENGKISTQPLIDPWFYTSGLPISDAYWARVKTNGHMTDVLIQMYERRTLIYIPTEAPGLQVQFGDVGRHYYAWRYQGGGCAAAP